MGFNPNTPTYLEDRQSEANPSCVMMQGLLGLSTNWYTEMQNTHINSDICIKDMELMKVVSPKKVILELIQWVMIHMIMTWSRIKQKNTILPVLEGSLSSGKQFKHTSH